ncbi:MAG TPA: TetR/AcrR family transcriptional regulator [Myxococcota bacterium]|nr:TetR/AcrR family transcriptional regulator [Myxococcota bacterium]
MQKRIPRAEQVHRNREQVLAAARKVFLSSGYGAATLDQIADAAGFSKGVVYSQFESKADLFLALLDRRIAERAAENEGIAKRAHGAAGMKAMIATAQRDTETERDWALVLLEFRLQAARDPELRRRYAELHRRTLAGVRATIETIFAGSASESLAEPAGYSAVLVLALIAGLVIERESETPLPQAVIDRALERLLGAEPAS